MENHTQIQINFGAHTVILDVMNPQTISMLQCIFFMSTVICTNYCMMEKNAHKKFSKQHTEDMHVHFIPISDGSTDFVNDFREWCCARNGKKGFQRLYDQTHIDCHKFIFQPNALSQNKNRRHLYMRTIARETYAWLYLFLSHPFGIFINFVLSLSTNAMRWNCMIFIVREQQHQFNAHFVWLMIARFLLRKCPFLHGTETPNFKPF